MDRSNVIEIAKKYSDIVVKHIPVKKVLLYGSYSKNTARKESDIDIAIITDRFEGDYLEIRAKLYKLRRQLDMRIEPVLLVDDGTDTSGFIDEVLSTGYLVYPN
ncbi:MAG: nucleotidyltransferase domain-containing protein [Firmicutes bacterium]|nr:nucleotidyltransferase domain-containing protein [Bacillota bacterium]